MKKLLIITLFLFAFLKLSAQHKTLDSLRHALIIAKTDTAKFEAIRAIGSIYFVSKIDSAIYFDQQGYFLAAKNNWVKTQYGELVNLGTDFDQLGDYGTAISYYLKSLRIAERLHDELVVANIQMNLGISYANLDDQKNALLYLKSAQKLLVVKPGVTPAILASYKLMGAVNLIEIGRCYLSLGKLDSAEYYLTAGNQGYLKLKGVAHISEAKRYFGDLETAKGNKIRALQYYRQDITNAGSIDDGAEISEVYLSMGTLYYKYKLLDSAIYYAHKSMENAYKGNFKRLILEAEKMLYKYYEEAGNLPEAFKYFKTSTALKDSLYGQDKIKQILNLDFDEKQRQQDLLNAEIGVKNRLRTYILSVGAGLLLLLSLIFWRNSRQRRLANKLLMSKNDAVEMAMSQLKVTQTQLVQSEKMASLGELTAGIAHEIQNPLNFVNNFSEVSVELADEIIEEMTKEDVAEAILIVAEIKQNLQKIVHHGKRADSIVKNMLQHSRTNSREKQLTDINALVEESLKLSYHAVRSKDKLFNAELVTVFEANLSPVAIVPQEISRVMINLFSNAFYAVKQKADQVEPHYLPTITVTTATDDVFLTITVKDNGIGMTDAVKEKMMQPFFTTKPTGEGTGLGLSLSYDTIVKGHNGRIDVKTKEGEFTELTISLPLER